MVQTIVVQNIVGAINAQLALAKGKVSSALNIYFHRSGLLQDSRLMLKPHGLAAVVDRTIVSRESPRSEGSSFRGG